MGHGLPAVIPSESQILPGSHAVEAVQEESVPGTLLTWPWPEQ
jgi:hypothetical protein